MPTVSECWDHYSRNHLSQTCDADTNRRYWGRLQWFAGMQVDAVTPSEVERYINERGVQVATINRELALLRACFRHAERHKLIDKAPIIKTVPGAKIKARALSKAEASRVIKAADQSDNWRERVYVRLALGTGARPGAIVDLKWSQVDRADKIIDYRVFDKLSPRRKRRAIVPINAMVTAALKEAWANKDGEYVLHWHGRKLSSPRPLMARVTKRAGIKDCSPHVLRHTVVSLLLQDDVDLLKVSRLIGHASVRTTETIYFQHQPKWLSDTVSILDDL